MSLYGRLHGKHYGRLYGEAATLLIPPGGKSGLYGRLYGRQHGRFYGDLVATATIDLSALILPLRARSSLPRQSPAHNITDDFTRARNGHT